MGVSDNLDSLFNYVVIMELEMMRVAEALPFWIPPTPREIRLKKLNVSPNLYCNVLSLIVYFVGKLMY